MARLTFGPERTDVPRSGGSAILSAAGDPVLIYTDLAGTTLADIQTPAAAAIPGSRMIVNTFSEWPEFLGTEDGQDPLFISVNNGPIRPIYSSFFNRFAAIVESLSGLMLDQQSLQQLSDRLNALGDTPTTDDVIALILQYAGSPTAPAQPPGPATNLTNTVVGDTATLHYTPSSTATSAIVEQDGVAISGPTNAPATGTYVISGMSPGTYTLGVKMHNSVGTSTVVTTSVVIAQPVVTLSAPTGLVGAPNAGLVGLTWNAVAGETLGYEIKEGGRTIHVGTGVLAYTEPTAVSAATHTYTVAALNSNGAGTTASVAVIVPSAASPITLTDKGTTTETGDSAATTIVSGSITPVAGRVEVAAVSQYRISSAPGSSLIDAWGGTGGTAWAKVLSALESVSGDYAPIDIFTRTTPASPSAGAITATRTTPDNEFWYGKLTAAELVNALSSTPLRTASNVGTASSITADLGGTPDALSIVFSVCTSLQATGTLTPPAGFTALTNTQPTGGTAMAVAYKIGSNTQTHTWTGLNTYGNVVAAIEIGQVTAPVTPTGKPPTLTGLVSHITPQPNGKSLISFGFDPEPTAEGIIFFEGAQGFTPNPATNQIASPLVNGATTTAFGDVTPRDNGTTVDYYAQWYNSFGPSTSRTKITVVIPAVITDPSDLGPKLGFSAEDLEPGVGDSWRNGQEVVGDMAALGNTTAKWFTLWCSPGAGFCKHMIDAAAYYMAPGRALEGMKPAFTFPLGMSSLSSAAVASGAANAAIADVATHLQAAIDDPSNPIQAGQFSCRWGHEFPIAGIGPYSITNNAASMDSFSNAFGVSYDVFKGICASAIIVCCSYSTDYDISRALPFPTAAFPNKAYKCNAFGFDFYGDSSFPGAEKSGGGPYDPPADAVAYWNALYYHNGSPSNPPPGSPAWQRKVGKDAGLPFAIDECGPMARFALPAAGCGDYPQFGTNVGVIHGADDVLYINWFTAGATFEGQKQDHDWTDGHFNALLAALRAVYGD